MDLTRLREITGEDREVENMLLNLFIETANRVLENLKSGSADWKAFVHELKGAAANLGVESLYQACKTHEFKELQGTDRARFLGQIEATITELKALLA